MKHIPWDAVRFESLCAPVGSPGPPHVWKINSTANGQVREDPADSLKIRSSQICWIGWEVLSVTHRQCFKIRNYITAVPPLSAIRRSRKICFLPITTVSPELLGHPSVPCHLLQEPLPEPPFKTTRCTLPPCHMHCSLPLILHNT